MGSLGHVVTSNGILSQGVPSQGVPSHGVLSHPNDAIVREGDVATLPLLDVVTQTPITEKVLVVNPSYFVIATTIIGGNTQRLGFRVAKFKDRSRTHVGGVKITKVFSEGIWLAAGFRPNDRITHVAGLPTMSNKELENAMRTLTNTPIDNMLNVQVNRKMCLSSRNFTLVPIMTQSDSIGSQFVIV